MQRLTYKTVEATKEHINALAQYVRGPGHQVLQETTLSLSTPTFHPFFPWLQGAAVNAECKRKKIGFTLTPSASAPERETGSSLERKNRKKSLLLPEKEVASAIKIHLPHYGTEEAPLSPNISYKYQDIQELATAGFFQCLDILTI